MNTLVFEGAQLIRKPNRWLAGLAATPFALALLAVLHTLVADSRAFIIAPHLLVLGAIALLSVLKRRPWATFDTERVRADFDGLRVGDDVTPRDQITRALYVPDGAAHTPLVRVERRRRAAVEVVVQSEADAQRILAALGRDVSRAKVTFRAWSPLFGSRLRFLVVPVMMATGALMVSLIPRTPGAPPYLWIAVMGAMGVAFGVPSRVEVGADGVLVRWMGTRRFIAARDIGSTERFEKGFGRNRRVGVTLHLVGGDTYDIVSGSARWDDDDAAALAERVDEVIAAHRVGAAGSAAELARAGRPVREWIRALRGIGVGAEANFRHAGLDRELLWQVFESPTAAPDERAAAAVALATQATPETSRRIRVTADALAEPSLRGAIAAATGDDDAALADALRAIDEQQQQRG